MKPVPSHWVSCPLSYQGRLLRIFLKSGMWLCRLSSNSINAVLPGTYHRRKFKCIANCQLNILSQRLDQSLVGPKTKQPARPRMTRTPAYCMESGFWQVNRPKWQRKNWEKLRIDVYQGGWVKKVKRFLDRAWWQAVLRGVIMFFRWFIYYLVIRYYIRFTVQDSFGPVESN